MANYFVIGNKFKPYTFDELIKPYQIYGEAYKEQEAALEKASEDKFSGDYLNPQLDPEAYNMYMAAFKNLENVSEELATKGLSSSIKSKVRSAAKNYRDTMGALTDAQAKLDAERARRLSLGDSYVYRNDDLRIKDFLYGNTPDQSGVDLDKVSKDIAVKFGAMAKGISSTSWDKVLNSGSNPIRGYFDISTTTGLANAQLHTILGLTDKEFNETIKDLSETEKSQMREFRDTAKQEKDTINYDKYSDLNKKRIDNAIATGAVTALGTTTHQYQVDRSYDPTYERQLSLLAPKYPYWDFAKGKIKKGWKQTNKGTWISPDGIEYGNGQDSSKPKDRTKYLGIAHYGKTGEVSYYDDLKDLKDNGIPLIKDNRIPLSSSVDERGNHIDILNNRNLNILRNRFNLGKEATEQTILNYANENGIAIDIINHPKKEKQELIIIDSKSQLAGTIGNSSGIVDILGEEIFTANMEPVK